MLTPTPTPTPPPTPPPTRARGPQTSSYPDGWLISEYDLHKLMIRRASWAQDSDGNRQLDVVHDFALVEALRKSFFVAGNVKMSGYGWDSQETAVFFEKALSPAKQQDRGSNCESDLVEREEGSDGYDRHDEHGVEHDTPTTGDSRRGSVTEIVVDTATTLGKSMTLTTQESVREVKSKLLRVYFERFR